MRSCYVRTGYFEDWRGQLRTKLLEHEVMWGHSSSSSSSSSSSNSSSSSSGGEEVLLRRTGVNRGRLIWKGWSGGPGTKILCVLRFSSRQRSCSSFVLDHLIETWNLLKTLTGKVELQSTSPWGPTVPSGPPTIMASAVSHTFTILISNFPQRWNKYFYGWKYNLVENWKIDEH